MVFSCLLKLSKVTKHAWPTSTACQEHTQTSDNVDLNVVHKHADSFCDKKEDGAAMAGNLVGTDGVSILLSGMVVTYTYDGQRIKDRGISVLIPVHCIPLARVLLTMSDPPRTHRCLLARRHKLCSPH